MDGWSEAQEQAYQQYAQTGQLWKKAQAMYPDDMPEKEGLLHGASVFTLLLNKTIQIEQAKSFDESLTRAQRTSWRVLRDWYNGKYQSESLTKPLQQFISFLHSVESPSKWYTIDDFPDIEKSLYHSTIARLFEAEFFPRRINFSDEPDDVYMTWPELSRYLRHAREEALLHATCQRLGFHHLPEQPLVAKEDVQDVLSSTLDPCWWLESSKHSEEMPYYLWEVASKRTVIVASLATRPLYTCVSHTWGRWRIRNASFVIDGVPWSVPAVTRFDVRTLADIFFERVWTTPYLWFDLFCIPQDGSELATTEIARQHTIFKNSTVAAAWINGVSSWEIEASAIEWLSLSYIRATTSPSLYSIEDALAKARVPADQHIAAIGEQTPLKGEDIFRLQDQVLNAASLTLQPGAWFTSLWTLQEAYLCPHMILLSWDWEPLRDKAGYLITLDNQIALAEIASSVLQYSKYPGSDFRRPTAYNAERGLQAVQDPKKQPSEVPEGVREMLALVNMTKMSDLCRPSPTSVLVLGNMRRCSESRAQAIMCILGTTEWYNQYISVHDRPPPETNLVLGMYPHAFVEEVANKFGAPFFLTTKPTSSTRFIYRAVILQRSLGSMLPFAAGHGRRSVGSPPQLAEGMELEDHPDVRSWVIKANGRVLIPKAGILASSRAQKDPWNEMAWIMDCHPEKSSLKEERMTDWLKKQSSTYHWYAVALARDSGSIHGLILKEARPRFSRMRFLVKCGIFVTYTQGFPASKNVNWTLL
ncbi:hypothetical protein BDV96DRAFT_561309 [Lophiotrema nucula]|uniref:Heterokaryon incompatibility domain-containing protein n=1 Tax=Lophiotrema nucula TaxID=690887 RepID=A0A6A5ZU05_9PLEO|nr:hypothetical protein BDV96DRAFT_561309 [Lophiotrema nucula]